MKIAIVVIATLALFAAFTFAAEEPEHHDEFDLDSDLVAMRKGNPISKIVDAVKKVYGKICKKHNNDVCKRWAKKTITWENAKKLGKELKPYAKAFCAGAEGSSPQMAVACAVILIL